MTAKLKYVVETYNIGIHVGIWVRNAVTHPALSREIHNNVEMVLLEQRLK